MPAAAAVLNPRNNVSYTRETHKPNTKLQFQNESGSQPLYRFIIFTGISHWKSIPILGLTKTGIPYTCPQMGSEPKEAQRMFWGLSPVIEGKLGLPIF